MKAVDLRDSIIPISRFNKGEASKIIEELETNPVKFIFKNNAPAGVLLHIEKYYSLLEELENMALYLEAEKRIWDNKPTDNISFEEVMKNNNLTLKALADVEVDID